MTIIQYILLFILLSIQGKSTETIYFDVVKNDKILGELIATKTTHNDTTFYESYTVINTTIIENIQVVYDINVQDINHIFSFSNANISINGKQRSNTTINRGADNYSIKRHRKKEQFLDQSKYFPAIKLLFQEPTHIEKVLSEESGEIHNLYFQQNNTYKKVNPKGNENLYKYQNGKLKNAIIDIGIVKFELHSRS